jgi:hypothetical protein
MKILENGQSKTEEAMWISFHFLHLLLAYKNSYQKPP